ncbi:alpha/beta hydrolase [Alphaproteobacteria bacterium]|nr:alpha/beta hydrolase [Alphaproteobacteria bacterium]
MKHVLHGEEIHIATGGRDFDPDGDVLVLLHGSGQNHLTWILQGRYLAHRGFSVLAPDFPAHGLSQGSPLDTIEAQASWVIGLLDSLDVAKATLVGHSQGVLVALEAAASYPDKVKSLVLIAGAMAIPVNDHLVSMSDTALSKAIGMMTSWGHGPDAHMYDNSMPGHSFLGYGKQIMQMNNRAALLADLNACNAYKNGEVAATSIAIPALCILAKKDKMTPLKFGKAMANAIKGAEVTVIEGAGHFLPGETPIAVNKALCGFLQR